MAETPFFSKAMVVYRSHSIPTMIFSLTIRAYSQIGSRLVYLSIILYIYTIDATLAIYNTMCHKYSIPVYPKRTVAARAHKIIPPVSRWRLMGFNQKRQRQKFFFLFFFGRWCCIRCRVSERTASREIAFKC